MSDLFSQAETIFIKACTALGFVICIQKSLQLILRSAFYTQHLVDLILGKYCSYDALY